MHYIYLQKTYSNTLVNIRGKKKSFNLIYEPALHKNPSNLLFSECELTRRDVTHGKQAHACVSINCPFLSLTVGLAAVVHEARVVPFGSRIYNPILRTNSV